MNAPMSLVDRLGEFYSREEAQAWLHEPNALLGGQRAVDLIHDGRSEEVLMAIERLSALVYL